MGNVINVKNYEEIIRIRGDGGAYETIQPKFEEVVYVTKIINTTDGGDSGTSTIYVGTAEETLGGHRVVALHDGLVGYADYTTLTDVDAVLGLTTAAVLAGSETNVTLMGEVTESSWSWDTAKPIYLGVVGTLTQTVPTSGFVMKIGYPITSTSMMIDLGIPLITN